MNPWNKKNRKNDTKILILSEILKSRTEELKMLTRMTLSKKTLIIRVFFCLF